MSEHRMCAQLLLTILVVAWFYGGIEGWIPMPYGVLTHLALIAMLLASIWILWPMVVVEDGV